MLDKPKRRRFVLFLVKPSHYDDDGYVIQWVKSALPSNSLACLYGIAKNAMETAALGEDVDIEIFAVDETNTRVRPDKHRPPDFCRRRLRHGRLRRRAVEPVSRG